MNFNPGPTSNSLRSLLYSLKKTNVLKFVLNKNVFMMFSSHRRINSKRNILNNYLLFWNNARLIVTTTITISVTHHLNVAVFCDWHFGLFRFRNDNFQVFINLLKPAALKLFFSQMWSRRDFPCRTWYPRAPGLKFINIYIKVASDSCQAK